MDKESATLCESYACFQITVENRDYHHLSQNETEFNSRTPTGQSRHGESGNQIAVFGRRGARPFTREEANRYLRDGNPYTVPNDPPK